jgi:hypothetical protein
MGGFFSGSGSSLLQDVSNDLWLMLFLIIFVGQTLIQTFLLFQIGAAIRNKVKR